MRIRHLRCCACALALSLVAAMASAQKVASIAARNVVHIDASGPSPAPAAVPEHLGSNRAPNGDVIAVNSQYLTLNGKPWMPVMGEFHFSRYPQAQWEEEILKMKAAGVDIISTYVIWIHHEQVEGIFDWEGQRDLRAFTELCAKHGMYVYPRIGPWAHAETRNGGLPDWVMKKSSVRQNDPVYLQEVGLFYAQIAQQLHGLLWKDGGPVIGLQIENEYRDTGVGKGAEHIRTLKKMAVDDGLDVPLYTVTGWDGAAIPLDAALPVFGGYPDAPWDGSAYKLPPNEVYAFRFANRSAGSMGAIGSSGQSAATSYQGTPFLTAEVGDGIEDTYFRRPVVSADDVAAIAPVMLGSGANLLGYYMFHGGRNPDGGDITLQESQRTGYPTDVPVKSYDFQAPLGEFGQERPSLRKLKLVHYFLEDFGAQLAPMLPHAPAVLPANPADVSVPRTSARTLGDAGFIFFNNHVRGATDRAFQKFQVQLKLPGGVTTIPQQPIDLPANAYGIWPVNLDIQGTMLRYSTAQLFKRVATAKQTYYFFFAVPGISPELMFDSNANVLHMDGAVQQVKSAAGMRLRVAAGGSASIELPHAVTVMVVTEAEAENFWRGDDPAMLLRSGADAFSSGSTWTLQQNGNADFAFTLFGDHAQPSSTQLGLHAHASQSAHAPIDSFGIQVKAVELPVSVQSVSAASPRKPFTLGAALSWRPTPIPFAPDDNEFAAAAKWTVRLPAIPKAPQLADIFLRICYTGDVARLSDGDVLLDDNFWNGSPWEIGLAETGQMLQTKQSLELSILPMPSIFPMYVEHPKQLRFRGDIADNLTHVDLIPRYQVTVQIPARQVQ